MLMNQLAIIIPFYKLSFFRENLESLAAQTDKRFHVYIGNDASPEDPEELLKEFNGKFNFTYKRFNENLGGTSLTKQWERCIAMMQDEEWFMILGDDDYLHPDAVNGFYQTLKINDNRKVLRYAVQVINERDGTNSDDIKYIDEESSAEFIVKRVKGLVRSSLSEYVFKTSCFHQYGIDSYPNAFYSDNMMVLRYSEFGPIKNIENGNVKIRVSNINITGNKENHQDLVDAGYFFYTDLLTKYREKFSINQKRNFLVFMFDGFLTGKKQAKFCKVFFTIYVSTNLSTTLRFFLLYVKNFGYKMKKRYRLRN